MGKIRRSMADKTKAYFSMCQYRSYPIFMFVLVTFKNERKTFTKNEKLSQDYFCSQYDLNIYLNNVIKHRLHCNIPSLLEVKSFCVLVKLCHLIV